jgi:peptidoglycan hydrolase-like protein with peptidoglycan-binding domain
VKRIILLITVFSFCLTGCSTFAAKDIRNLKSRVSALEERQDAIATSTAPSTSGVTYVSQVEVEETYFAGDAESMTKKDIQAALKKAGYYDGPIDGKLGTKSRKAIRDFQSDKGLKVDGIVGPQTKKALLTYLVK